MRSTGRAPAKSERHQAGFLRAYIYNPCLYLSSLTPNKPSTPNCLCCTCTVHTESLHWVIYMRGENRPDEAHFWRALYCACAGGYDAHLAGALLRGYIHVW